MTSTRRSLPKSFSSFLLTATILTVALLAFVPVAFGQAENPGGDTVSKDLSLELGKGVSMKLVLIPAGKFKMGNHETPAETIKKLGGEEEQVSDEYPAHEVTISKPFYMGIYELTQAQWKAVMGTEPWLTKTALAYAGAQPRPEGFDDYPAVWMSSYDAIEFCRKLSKKTGMSVSLPTEAQWEYACRAGSTTTFSCGDELSKLIDYGWYGGIPAGQKEDYAHRVGQLKPNAWGLYDMHGNVWEFCSDWYDKDFYSRSPSVDPENTTETDLRCLRSGSFHSVPVVSRSSQRARWVGPKQVRYNYGLRVVVAADTAVPAAGDPAFVPLFNGKDLTNFQTEDAEKFWRIEDGVLIGENDAAKSEHYLWTTKKYSDFILEFDAKWKGTTKRGVDSGIELREPKLQLQLGISGSLRVDMTGSFYAGRKGYPKSGQATEAKALLNPEGEWNSLRLQAKGNTFSCWINGKKASEYTDANFSGAAPLGLQIHGDVVMKVEYRNLRIADLAAGEVLSSLNAKAGEIAVKDGETIAFLGDSITAAGRNPGGYCQFVLAALKDQGIKTTAVFAGIGGHKSDQMLARLEKDVLNHQPDWMTLSCGVNDVWHGKNGVALEPYKKNITEIVDRAQAAGVKVLLLTSTMIKEDQANELNQKLLAYNDFIRQLATDKGCLLADVNADMQLALKTPPPYRPDGKKLTSDGVHMNPYGNIMMGRGVAKALGATDVQLDESEKAWRSVSSHRVRLGEINLSIEAIEALSAAAKAEGTDLGGLLRKGAEARKDELLK